jgi:small multidrug resistance pump
VSGGTDHGPRDGRHEEQASELFRVEPGAHEPLADLAAAAGARLGESMHVPAPGPRRWVAYVFLAVAIVAGVTGTSALSISAGLTRPWPATVVGVAYLLCFLAMTRALRAIPISVVYAIWSGVGMALVTLIGWRLFGQTLDASEVVGIVLILAGVVVIHLFSDARVH